MRRAWPSLILILLLTPALPAVGESASRPVPRGDRAPVRDWFGYRMAAGPRELVVGAPLTVVDGRLEAGSVTVYPWFEEQAGPPRPGQTLSAPQPRLGGRFGAAVAVDGDRLVVGATGKACAYVFARDPNGSWTVVDTLVPPVKSGWPGSSWFGSAVAISGDFIAVGAPSQKGAPAAASAGSVHVYRGVPGGHFVYQETLEDPGGEPGDGFGMRLALSGRTLVVGAPRDHFERWWFRGSVQVFRRSEEDRWEHEAELDPPGRPWDWSHFGGDVSLDGEDRIAIGGAVSRWALTGAAAVYQRDEQGAWRGEAVRPPLAPGQPPPYRLPSSTSTELRLSGDLLLLAMAHPAPGYQEPGVLVFRKTESEWRQVEVLHLPRQNAAKQFWYLSLALRGEEAVVGVLHHDTSVGARARGSAHVFSLPRR